MKPARVGRGRTPPSGILTPLLGVLGLACATPEATPGPAAAAGGCTGGGHATAELPAGEVALRTPTGPCGIAQSWRTMTDTARPEPHPDHADDDRRLSVRIWYPTQETPSADAAPYMPAEEAIAYAEPFGRPVGWEAAVHTHSRQGGTVLGPDLPVVLFSHGLGNLRSAFQSHIEQLVSRGYVVVAIAHSYDTPVALFEDGSQILQDSGWWRDDNWRYGNEHLLDWASDASFVLDELERIDADDPQGVLTGALDLSQVGMFGHSYGGAAARQACADDPRFAACANLDGSFFGSDIVEPLDTPLMMQLRGDHDGTDLTVEAVWGAATQAPTYRVVIEDVEHGSFSDDPMLQRHFTGDTSAFGSRDAAEATDISVAYVGAFFDRHLLGEAGDLLDGPGSWGGVEVQTRP